MFKKLFSREKPIKGIIVYLGLQDFWNSCSLEEQNSLIRYYQGGLGVDPSSSPIKGEINFSSNNVLKYLSAMIGWATNEKNYTLADKLISTGDNVDISKSLLLDAHFFWQIASECYYKQRDIREDALSLCEKYCIKDIDMFPAFKPVFDAEFGNVPRITTFQRLVVMYEKNGNIKDAIDICKLALEYGLTDSTKGGYENRLQKLQKKLKG